MRTLLNHFECPSLGRFQPAPHTVVDLPAFALKIEFAVDEEVATLAGGERCLAVLKADRWRLAALVN
jgi:hypothetical protein